MAKATIRYSDLTKKWYASIYEIDSKGNRHLQETYSFKTKNKTLDYLRMCFFNVPQGGKNG